MKLLVISGAFPPHRSGEATNTLFLARALAARGVEVHVLTGRDAADPGLRGVNVHRIMQKWTWAELPRLLRFVRTCAPDAVLLMYIGWIYRYQFMATFLPTFVKRALPGVTFVTRFENVMGTEPRRTSLLARAIRKLLAVADRRGNVNYGFGTLLRDSDRLIVLSEAHRAIVSECLPGAERRTFLIPPPANMRVVDEAGGEARRRGREKLAMSDEHFVIAYIGYVHAGKGLETLLRAFRDVSKTRDEARLVMIGGSIAAESGNTEGYHSKLVDLAHDLGVADRVTWTGEYSWDREDASLYLRAADVCVLPFRRGIHLNNSSLASAAAHGLPIIATRGDVLEQAFSHGRNVFLCPPDSPEALAAGIETMMADAGLRQRLRAGSRELAREWFSWDRTVERTLDLLGGAELLARRGAAGP